MMFQRATLLFILASVGFASGCSSSQLGYPLNPAITPVTKLTTRKEVIANIGIPDSIRYVDDNRFYIYSFSEGRGGGFGIGTVHGTEGSGPRRKLRVRFDRAGVKTLVLRFAKLESA